MSDSIVLNAQSRSDLGKGASRRLRRTGTIPAVVFGSGEPISIQIEHKNIWKAQESEAFYASVLTLNIDGTETDVILKDLQRHPAKQIIMHADFQRADDSVTITMVIPLHYINGDTAKGVKEQGGTLQIDANTIKITCVPSKIPEFIEVDMADVELGQIVHIADLNFPEGVSSVDLNLGESHNHAIAQVKAIKGAVADEDEAEAAPEAASEE
ncbi:MAG: 50S ribosomal protein L25/general stress protein Ctc [Pseudomonadales bacterium]|nr:50S ribosomal protein L25/general stress protein Ctc [Pseudomonadales bacterium]